MYRFEGFVEELKQYLDLTLLRLKMFVKKFHPETPPFNFSENSA